MAGQSTVEASFRQRRVRGMRAVRHVQGTNQKLGRSFFGRAEEEDVAGRKITEITRALGLFELLKRFGLFAGKPGLEGRPRPEVVGRDFGREEWQSGQSAD